MPNDEHGLPPETISDDRAGAVAEAAAPKRLGSAPMFCLDKKQERTLEICLLIISIGLAMLLFQLRNQSLVVLNLFYLPVALGALFLGRYRAGVLTLFCVVAVLAVSMVKLGSSHSAGSPLVTALTLTFWGAVMGLNALLIGTLSDERLANLRDLHDAHVGVVEVLSQYLTSADAELKVRGQRVADLSQRVAIGLNLSPQEVDDIRVAALLQDMGNFEVTTKVIRRAVDDLNRDPQRDKGVHTFCGSDFAQSLGRVLSGTLEVMSHYRDPLRPPGEFDDRAATADLPLAAKILYTVRDYVRLVEEGSGAEGQRDAWSALDELRADVGAHHHPSVLLALERIETRGNGQGSYIARLEAELTKRRIGGTDKHSAAEAARNEAASHV
jgi:hypothetical protein